MVDTVPDLSNRRGALGDVSHLGERGIAFERGLSLSEVAGVESIYSFRFRPDRRETVTIGPAGSQ